MLDRSFLVRTAVLAASGAMLMAATVPVAASGNDETRSVSAPVSSTTNSQPEKKYCIEYMITGSMLPHRECRTRADWEARGATFKTKTGRAGYTTVRGF